MVWNGAVTAGGPASPLPQPFIAKHVLAEFERACSSIPETSKRAILCSLAALDAARGHLAFARLAIAAKDPSAAEHEMPAVIASAADTFRPYSTLANWYAKGIRSFLAKPPTDAGALVLSCAWSSAPSWIQGN